MDVNSENTTPVGNTSNSMPSLDATDDIVESEAIPASDAIPPVISSESTETEDNLNPEDSTDIPVEPMNIAITNVESVATDSVDTETESTASAQIEVPPITSTEMPSEPQPENNEENNEDPSEAIDQFIKKIADEQLSSKRVPSESVEDNVENQLSEKSADLTEAEEPLLPPQLRDELLTTQTNASTSKMEEDKESKSELDVPVTKDNASTETKTVDKEGTEMDDRERLLAILKDPEPVEPKASTVKETLPEDKEPKSEPIDIAEGILAPIDVSKDPQMIKKAQEEIKAIDVLICGNCHEAFHFVEEFQQHKSKQCNKKSTLTAQCEAESKPQVWGFTLWKAKQSKISKDGSPPPSSWAIYQKWCKLPQLDKDAWITAGQTLQFCSKIANAKITEFRPKVVTPPQVAEKDPLLIDSESNKENTKGVDKIKSTTELIKKGIVKPVKLNNDVTILPSVKVCQVPIDLNSNKAIRTTKVLSTQAQEYNVEKIVAKRFNPRRKIWEYQIKWENFPSDANTWEPVSNLNHCKQLLEQFEEQLRKLKEEKAKQAAAASAKGRGKPQKSTEDFASKSFTGSSSSGEFTPRRPTRSSKQKAISTVKAWCGTMSDEETVQGGVKRPREDDDSDSSFDKKVKFEEEDSDSEIEEKPKVGKKVVKTPTAPLAKKVIKNGATPPVSPTKQILPQNILIPDANGVVRINQKQLPSLSTGVYIMSKTAGIIKLDSATSKVATSGGQTIVKVAPKIGQTQIKIVKKDGTITKKVIQMSPKDVVPPAVKSKPVVPEIKSVASTKGKAINEKPAAKTYSKVNRGPKKISEPAKEAPPPAKEAPPPVEEPEKEEPGTEESDDGLEPLEFPEEIPEVRPESPPGEFVLDPITGKIAGQEYPDPSVEPPEEEKKPVKVELETDSLDNIVKLAAADITEDDLKNDSLSMEVDQEEPPRAPMQQSHHQTISMVTSTPKPTKIMTTPRVTTKIVSARPSTTTAGQSILNKALTNTGVTLQPRVVGGMNMRSPRAPQPRVINQSIGQRGMTMQQTIRSITTTGPQQRTRQIAPKTTVKSKFNISPQPIITRVQPKVAMQSIANNKVGVFSNKSPLKSPPIRTMPIIQQTRRVGNTIIRTVNNPTKPQPRIVQTVYKVSPKLSPRKEVVTTRVQKQMKPKPVISMPSLLGDEDDGLATLVRKEPQKVTTRIVQRSPTKTIVPEATPTDSMAMVVPIEESISKTEPAVEQTAMENTQEPTASAADNAPAGESTAEGVTDLSSFTLADSENPIFITGDDGTVYQVAGQNEQGQTILITQGPDGQQQCLLVTNELGEASAEENSAEENATAATTAANDASTEQAATVVSQQQTTTEMALSEEMEPQHQEGEEGVVVSEAENVTEPLHIKTDGTEPEGDGSDQVVAQVVRAEPPSPGGTHKVVVMLPDGNLMVTAVSPEEYASLELE